MVNSSGRNGSNNGTRPPDNILKAALEQYQLECLTVQKKLERLSLEFDYKIGSNKLNKLHNELGVLSSRKIGRKISQATATSMVDDVLADDIHSNNGPDVVKKFVQIRYNVTLPRRMVREAQLLLDPTGGAKRSGGAARRKVPRATLISLGPWAEFCCDGHEKLSSKALLMGPVGIPIYEIRDKASGCLIKLQVVPDARLSDTIGHLYLDMVEEWGCIPLQITTDKGSETGVVYAFEVAFREIHAEEVSLVKFPAFVAVQSVHNIIAESLWHWMRKTLTGDIEAIIKSGQTEGIFISTDAIHVQLFQWLWPKIVQKHLDEFILFWNTSKPRTQQNKALPSGAVRNDVFVNPTAHNLERVSVPVPREIVEHCRSEIGTSREDSFRWVSPEFAAAAEWAYETVGRPTLSAKFGWLTYQKMLPHIQTYMFEDGLQ